MNNGWKPTKLGEILTKSDESIELKPDEIYRRVTVRLWGKGVTLRGEVTGGEIAATKQRVVHARQFIASRIDARNGAFGLVPELLEGAVVTSDFPIFSLNQSRVLPEFLEWLSKTNGFVELCKAASEGTTNRVRLKENRFLALEILLPPLGEQRRVVARIQELAAQIEEANRLRHQAAEEAQALFEASVGRRFVELSKLPTRTLETLTTKIGSGSTPMGGRAAYPTSGIPFIRSMNVRMRQFQWDDIAFISSDTHEQMSGTRVRPRDVLLNITGASIGRVACAPGDIAEANVNQHVAIIRPTEELEARYLMYWLSQPAIQEFINDEQKGATRQGFTKTQIQAFEIPMPPLPEQRRIVAELDALQAEVDALKRLQAETTAELDALLPSILDKAFKGAL
jgi:type I restriction enzyme S subunit